MSPNSGEGQPIFPEISLAEVEEHKRDLVAIFPMREEGIQFLNQANAWGSVNLKREPKFVALYVSGDYRQLRYLCSVDSITPVSDVDSSIQTKLKEHNAYDSEKYVISFTDIYVLKHPIPFSGGQQGIIRGLQYTTLETLINASGTDEL